MSPAKGEKLIEVKGLEKHFKHVEVLRGINIDICKGDVVAVIGPSGSGKSTFLRCLNLLEEPTGGQIVFEGVDITSKEILEDALRHYTGTVLYVSHDRYFINQTATRILELTGQTFLNYIGNYDYYLEKRELMNQLYTDPSVSGSSGFSGAVAAAGRGSSASDSSAAAKYAAASSASLQSENKMDWKAQKEEQARIRKRQNDLKKTEEEILRLETRDGEIDQLLSQEEIYTDVSRLMELNQEKESIQSSLEELYEKWEELAD